jgi:hypothetical protein
MNKENVDLTRKLMNAVNEIEGGYDDAVSRQTPNDGYGSEVHGEKQNPLFAVRDLVEMAAEELQYGGVDNAKRYLEYAKQGLDEIIG